MAEPFLGEIRNFAFGIVPRGWAPCNGQLLSVQQNVALFSLLGVTYGGDGRATFALPNLQGRVPVETGPSIAYGTSAGEENHTLTVNEIPAHTHQATGGSDGTTAIPAANTWGTKLASYATTANTTMAPAALGTAGSSQAHSNMQPYLVTNFCIALQGIFPPRN